MNRIWKNWETTAPAVTIVFVWVIKYFGTVEIPTEVATAITAILTAIGLGLAQDAKDDTAVR